MEDLKQQLSSEFKTQLENLGKTDVGSDEYKVATDGVTKVADRIIEIEKIENEQALKAQQVKDDKRDKIIRNVIEGTKVVGGFGLAAWAFVASMNFEKEGTLTTQGGRSAINQLLKFIKF